MMDTKKIDLLQALPLFDHCSREQLAHIAARIELCKRPKFSYVYLPDQPTTELFILLEGCVKIGSHHEDGREVLKSILHPKAIFGELGLTQQARRIDFARAMSEPLTYLSIKVTDLQEFMRQDGELGFKVMQLLGCRLREAEAKLEALMVKDARARIIDFLKDSAEKQGRRVGFETLLKHSLTQQDIANLTGTSRQTVTSVLNELRKNNQIYFTRRSILIRDMASLA